MTARAAAGAFAPVRRKTPTRPRFGPRLCGPEPSGRPARHALIGPQQENRERRMARFKVVTPKGASFTVAGGGYAYEKEALDPIDAEIIEAPANEAEFIAAAKQADAIYAKGMPITKAI